MKCVLVAFVALAVAAPRAVDGAALRARGPVVANGSSTVKALASGTEMEKVRAQLVKVTVGLKPMLDPKGALAATEVEASLQSLYEEAQVALKETAGKTDHASLVRLQNVSAQVHGLFKALTSRQERLMAEGEDQQNSLLLGVLMTKQHEPMDHQLAVLKATDFAALPVTKAILAAGDMKTALFRQAAAYFDAHPHAAAATAPNTPAARKQDLSAIVSTLQARLQHLELSTARSRALHENETKHLKEEEAKFMKTSTAKARAVRSLRKSEDRKFAKMMAIEGKDAQSMKEAITAIQKGDIKGLERVQAALSASVTAMQSHNGGFLVLVQESLREVGMDCPYCVAQCVDKCHNEGKPYVGCLTECADAGK